MSNCTSSDWQAPSETSPHHRPKGGHDLLRGAFRSSRGAPCPGVLRVSRLPSVAMAPSVVVELDIEMLFEEPYLCGKPLLASVPLGSAFRVVRRVRRGHCPGFLKWPCLPHSAQSSQLPFARWGFLTKSTSFLTFRVKNVCIPACSGTKCGRTVSNGFVCAPEVIGWIRFNVCVDDR